MIWNNPIEDDQGRFEQLAKRFPPKLSRKFSVLWPHKNHIEGLLTKRASYEDIRLLLEDAKIIVSKNTLYRFCHQVLGKKSVRNGRASAEKVSPSPIFSIQPPIIKLPIEKLGAVAQPPREQRGQPERYDGPWSKKKNGPRIANPKNL